MPAPTAVQAQGLGCSDGQGGIVTTCTSDIRQQFLQQRLDRTIAVQPEAGHIARRFNGNPAANGAAPFTVAPGDDAATLKTSLSQWGSFIARSDARAIEEAKKLAPEGMVLKAPEAVRDNNVDVWTETKFHHFNGRGASREGYRSDIGADYALGDNLILGALVQTENVEQSAAAWGSSTAAGEAFMAGPYVAMRLTPNLILDAKAAWGQGNDTIGAGGAASTFDTRRSLTEAQLKGNWNWNDWRLSPSASVSHVTEAPSGVPGSAVEVQRLTVEPEIGRAVSLSNGRVVEPFVHYKSSLDLDAAGALFDPGAASGIDAQGTVEGTVGGGLTLSKQNEYTIRATTDVGGVGAEGDKSLSSRVQVSIPLD